MRPYDKKQFGKSYYNCKCKHCGNPKAERKADKTAARQLSKIQLKKEIVENTITREDFRVATDEYGYEAIEDYNLCILIPFTDSLRKIAPELAWADSDGDWENMFEPRALRALPNKMKKWAPQTNEGYTKLLEKIYQDRGSRGERIQKKASNRV